MKNKKSIYILLPLVLIIWGVVFWKIFSGKGGGAQIVNSAPQKILEKVEERKEEKVLLAYNYNDPFLKQIKGNISRKEESGTKKKIPLKRIVRWPTVEFKGAVKSRKNKNPVGLLKIGKKEYLVREEQVKDNITVFAIANDSIGLEYKLNKRFFKRKGL